MPDPTPTRRDLLSAALASLGMAEQPRELPPTGADLGSLFPEIDKLARANRYRLSFLDGPSRGFEELRTAARGRILDLLLYRPEKIDPKAEVVERIDCGDHVREKVLFWTSPFFRVPA
jgi:hypothetical protein